ncbi:MAG: MFS transporter [Candidatus Caldarchaeum sp.]|nr:MFS transporter [Candidatus Caldarchaeum sp.]MDW8063171.1 MFS transporter [Candidatus Caldarchaeum sp.]MDW8435561.1 MFS transporter [Candidatus Caldarchaeum sp.]
MTTRRSGLLLLGLLVGIFLAAIDSTVVAIAMPSIVSSLLGLEIYSWAFTAYILTSTVAGPLWGRISDIYGRKPIYLLGLVIFLAGSVLCGLATDMVQLVVFRGIQGLGAGALLIITFTLIGEIFTLKERAKATGYTSSVWATASIVGPPLGGLIVDTIGWRWIFLINLPIGLLPIIVALKSFGSAPKSESKLDVRGSLLFLGGVSTLLLFLTEFQNLGASSSVLILFSGAFLGLFLVNERKTESPLIPFTLFKEKTLRTGFIGNLLAGFIFFGIIAYMPLYLQLVPAYSATLSGLLLLPLVLGWVVGANVSSRIVVKSSIKPPAIVSGLSLFIGTILLTFLSINEYLLLSGFALVGLGMGFTVSTFLISTQTLLPRGMLGVGTSLLSFLRLVGGAVAAAVLWLPIGSLVREYQIRSATDIVLSAAEKAAFTAGITVSIYVAAVAAALALLLYVFTPDVKLSETSRHPR